MAVKATRGQKNCRSHVPCFPLSFHPRGLSPCGRAFVGASSSLLWEAFLIPPTSHVVLLFVSQWRRWRLLSTVLAACASNTKIFGVTWGFPCGVMHRMGSGKLHPGATRGGSRLVFLRHRGVRCGTIPRLPWTNARGFEQTMCVEERSGRVLDAVSPRNVEVNSSV